MNPLELIFIKLGFVVSDTGIFYTTTHFARFIANVGVRGGEFKRLADNLYISSTNKLR
jgi:hypothetical protein